MICFWDSSIVVRGVGSGGDFEDSLGVGMVDGLDGSCFAVTC